MKYLFSLATTMFLVISSYAQNAEDTTDRFFHDALLNNFVGRWIASGTVHEQKFENVHFECDWILNHQFFQVHEKTKDIVPWLHIRYESLLFIGYDHANKRYAAHLINVFGADNPLGYLLFGTRNGNEIKFVSQFADPSDGSLDVQIFTWQPATESWHFVARNTTKGGEEIPYLDLNIKKQK